MFAREYGSGGDGVIGRRGSNGDERTGGERGSVFDVGVRRYAWYGGTTAEHGIFDGGQRRPQDPDRGSQVIGEFLFHVGIKRICCCDEHGGGLRIGPDRHGQQGAAQVRREDIHDVGKREDGSDKRDFSVLEHLVESVFRDGFLVDQGTDQGDSVNQDVGQRVPQLGARDSLVAGEIMAEFDRHWERR